MIEYIVWVVDKNVVGLVIQQSDILAMAINWVVCWQVRDVGRAEGYEISQILVGFQLISIVYFYNFFLYDLLFFCPSRLLLDHWLISIYFLGLGHHFNLLLNFYILLTACGYFMFLPVEIFKLYIWPDIFFLSIIISIVIFPFSSWGMWIHTACRFGFGPTLKSFGVCLSSDYLLRIESIRLFIVFFCLRKRVAWIEMVLIINFPASSHVISESPSFLFGLIALFHDT